MEIDIDVYFWMVDRGLFDDDQRNKVDMERNKVKLHREHGQRFENAFYIGKIMLLLKKSIMKISKKPFTLDPGISNMKDQITSTVKQQNWGVVCKELKKFGIKIDSEKKAKIIEGRTQHINEILGRLFDFDNGGLQSGRFQDGNLSDILGNNLDTSAISDVNGGNGVNSTILQYDPINKINNKKASMGQLEPLISSQSRKGGNDTQVVNSTELLSKQSVTSSPQKRGKMIVSNSVTSLNDINEHKDLAFAETTLEFILLSLSKSLQIKPKQAAGLLSNNHKFLIHIAVKGMKGNDYSKISQWYLDIYQNTQLLIQLIDNEKEQSAMKLTLNILKCGLYSQNQDLAIYCCRLLSKIGQEINNIGGQLTGLSWDWLITANNQNQQSNNNLPQSLNDVRVPDFNSSLIENGSPQKNENYPNNESGLQSMIFCYNRFLSEGGLLDNIFPLLIHFGRSNLTELMNHYLRLELNNDRLLHIQFCHELMVSHSHTVLFKDNILNNSAVFNEWLNIALRMAEFDGTNTVVERIAALTFLADVWELQSDKFEENAFQNAGTVGASTDTAQAILSVLKRGCRDRVKILRVQSFELLFKLLNVFASNRNQFAPVIYKSLTFLLIEFHQDSDTREHLMRHFVAIFQQVQTVPVAILCEPLIKQIEISQSGINVLQIALTQNSNPSYQFNIYDFEFFGVVVHHKRVNLQTAMQVVDLLINIATSNIFFANSSISIILEVIHKFSREPLLHTQFSQVTKAQIGLLEESEKLKSRLGQQRKKQRELQQKKLEDTLSKNKANKFVQNRLIEEDKQQQTDLDQELEAQSLARQTKERLIVNLLKQILMFGNDMIKQNMRNQLLGAYSRVDRSLRVKSSSIKYLLSLYGEEIPKMLQYFVENEHESSTNTDKIDQQLATLDNSTLETAVVQNQLILANYDGGNSSSSPNRKKQKGAQNLDRVLKDIERVKNNLTIKKENKELQDELKKAREDKVKAIAKKQVDNRKMYEHGVMPKEVRNYSLDPQKAQKQNQQNDDNQLQIKLIKPKDLDLSEIALEDNNNEDDEQRLLIPPIIQTNSKDIKAANKQVLKKLKEFKLYDLRMEEQKDQMAVRFFVQKNMRIFRNLFNKYANTSGPVTQVKSTFDAVSQKNQLITVAELLKMQREFKITNVQCSKDDVINMVRLINLEILKHRDGGQSSLSVFDFEGFVEYMLQLAVHLYSFESQMSPAEYLQKLFDYFKLIAQKNGSSNAKLFDDPSQFSVGDPKLLAELTKRIQNDPSYPLPDGFQKIREKEVVNNYVIPDYFPIDESKKIAIEVLDELLFDMLGLHFLEPMSEIKEVVKIKPNLKQVAKDKVMHELHSNSVVQPQRKLNSIKDRSRQNQQLSNSIDMSQLHKQSSNVRSTIGSNYPSATTDKTLLNLKPQIKSMFKSPRVSIPEKMTPITIKPQLGVEIKLEVAKAPAAMRPTVLEAAYVLEDMLYSVENGLSKLPPQGYQLQQKARIVNKVIEEKMKKQQDDEQQKQLDKQKLEQRKKMLRDQLERMKQDKEQRDQEELEKNPQLRKEKEKRQLAEQMIRQKQEREKQRQEKKDKDKPKGDINQMLNRLAEQQKNRMLREEEQKKRHEEEEKAARKAKPSINTILPKLEQEYKQLKEEKLKKAERQKAKEEREKLEDKEKREIESKKRNKIIAMHAETKQKAQMQKEKYKEDYIQFLNSPDVTNLMIAYDKSLLSAFEMACMQENPLEKQKLSYNTYLKYGNQHGIIPALLTAQEYMFIYKTMLRSKKDQQKLQSQQQQQDQYMSDVEGSKLNFSEFKEALIKVACLAKQKLFEMNDGDKSQLEVEPDLGQSKKGTRNKLSSLNSSVIVEKRKARDGSLTLKGAHNQSLTDVLGFDREFDVADMNGQTVEILFTYLNFKLDKQSLMQSVSRQPARRKNQADNKKSTISINQSQKKNLASGLDKRIQELDQQKSNEEQSQNAVNQNGRTELNKSNDSIVYNNRSNDQDQEEEEDQNDDDQNE